MLKKNKRKLLFMLIVTLFVVGILMNTALFISGNEYQKALSLLVESIAHIDETL